MVTSFYIVARGTDLYAVLGKKTRQVESREECGPASNASSQAISSVAVKQRVK